MDLVLFSIFLGLSLVLIALGLFKSEHTELALIGFVFLFLLGLVILNNQLEYKIGTATNSTFTYDLDYDGSGQTLLNASVEEVVDIYGTSKLGGPLSHTVGYWLIIGSFIGFVGVIMGIKHSWGFK